MTDMTFAEIDTRHEQSFAAANGHEPATFANVLVGVDGSSSGRDAIALGEGLRDPAGRLTLAHVVLTQGPTYSNFHSTPRGKQVQAMLDREREAMGVSAELTGTFAPSVGFGLHQLADERGADLLVVGSCSRGLIGRILVGDNARGTVSGATCPVAVAPHGWARRPRRLEMIGVAYNDTPAARAAMALARRVAAREDLTVRALTVLRPRPAAVGQAGYIDGGWGAPLDVLEQTASRRTRQIDGVTGRLAEGFATDELRSFGDQVDLLVVGSRGYGPLRRLILGSTSLRLVRSARCPVLVVPRSVGARPTPYR